MSDEIRVKSHLRVYTVRFVEDFAAELPHHATRGLFLIDEAVFALYRESIETHVPPERRILVPATERHKTLEYCRELLHELVATGVRRGDTLVAIGGGVLQDITAFVSSMLYRGVDWVFYPTTLLAQGDSCIGSKCSINMGEYKNLLGNFYPPKEIISDPHFLETLPKSEVKSGIGEMMHFFFIAGTDHAARIMSDYQSYVDGPARLIPFIRASLDIKRQVVERDEFDRGERRLFNYGHTFGHAIESVSDYGVNHGQAVTMGMDIANFVSLSHGLIDAKTYRTMRGTLDDNLPEFRLDAKTLPAYMRALSRDKKNEANMLGCILTHGPGRMELCQIPLDERLGDVIAQYFGIQQAAAIWA